MVPNTHDLENTYIEVSLLRKRVNWFLCYFAIVFFGHKYFGHIIRRIPLQAGVRLS